MKTLDCPRLCETCPIRKDIDGEPMFMGETWYEVEGAIGIDGMPVKIEYRKDGLPVKERSSTIGIANISKLPDFRFPALGSDWDSGRVVNEFENCQGPLETRSGFLNLRKLVVCSALLNIN